MEHPGFFERTGPFKLAELLPGLDVSPVEGTAVERLATPIRDVRALSEAGPQDLSFLDNPKYVPQLKSTKAGACLVSAGNVEHVPPQTIALVSKSPYRSFALALARYYPGAGRPRTAAAAGPGSSVRAIDPTAVLEDGVELESGVVIGPEARIGRGTRIAAGAVIGYRVYIGRDGFIGPNSTVTHALLGNRVILHAGVRIGQDGFGFALSSRGHLKVPQIGRVIIQDDVEVGANSTIDRGALKDTVIGEGTKIDNLVQIGHNAVIGRHCVIAGLSGIAGSAELGDFVIMGGHSGFAGHIKVGNGAQLAAASHVNVDVAPGAQYLDAPGKPLKAWAREKALLKRVIDAEEKRGKS